jgi:DNA-binding XRE family transcriptional regulator
MITARQCRARRGWLNWPKKTLAAYAHVSTETIYRIENETRFVRDSARQKVKLALDKAGAPDIDP